LSPGNRFVRFFYNVTGPLIDPIARRLPRMSIGMFDVGTSVAFLFAWWAITLLSGLITSSMP
ncbi:MAG TPA: YggT family protein, partial [Ktedonobacterales bacterium]|nr:YggT family protein [Ktedonobacterales bacterium]